MPELDWETVEIDAIHEEDFWDLLTSAAASEGETGRRKQRTLHSGLGQKQVAGAASSCPHVLVKATFK